MKTPKKMTAIKLPKPKKGAKPKRITTKSMPGGAYTPGAKKKARSKKK